MAFDPVPWAVGGGARLDETHPRMQNYFLFNGTEGVLGATDLRVLALATPGTSVRIAPGGYNILGRGSGQLYEAYMGRNKSDETVPVPANNTASSRSDLVVLVVKDPYIPGSPWSVPVDRENGPYIEPVIIQGVPSTTRTIRSLGNTWSAITLARIDIPANTSTITQSMIVPLTTKVGQPSIPVPPPTTPKPPDADVPDNPPNIYFDLNPGPSSAQNLTSASINTWRVWPAAASWTVSIPSWANIMDVMITLHNVFVNDDVWGETRVEIGSGEAFSQATVYDQNPSGWERFAVVAGGTVTVPSGMRGKNKTFKMNARSLGVGGQHVGTLTVDRGSILQLNVTFKEQTGQ
jgi:hypothetical protein